MVKYLRKALLFIALGKRRPLAELKLSFSNLTSDGVREIERAKVRREHIEIMVEVLSKPDTASTEFLSKWTEEVAHSMAPTLTNRRRFLLYKYRWDIARLGEEEYKNLQSFIEYTESVCGELITEKIKDALSKAEEAAITRQYQDSIYKRFLSEQFFDDEFAN